VVGQKNVEIGEVTQRGQPLMAVVATEDVWVVANYKENQLAHMRPGQMISSAAVYVFAAAILVTLGSGSVRAKRWARALTLVISWYWMIMGFLVTVLLTAIIVVVVLLIILGAAGVLTGFHF